NAAADCSDFSRCFCADHQRQLTLRECHTAKAPEIEVIECDCFSSNLNVAFAGWGRRRYVGKFNLAIGDKSQRTHEGDQAGSRPMTSDTFCPPKPNELEIAWRKFASRALLGTTSRGIAGSGTA